MNVKQLGFTEFFENQYDYLKQNNKYKNCIPARITLEHKHSYRVRSGAFEWLATLSGHFIYTTVSRTDFPAVGDWVLVEKLQGEDKAIIHHVFERKSKFSRKMAGTIIDEQIVAANVDIVFIAMSLNEDFNIRRLERYLIAAWDSGAKPVVVLTKADLCDDVESFERRVNNIAFGVEVFPVYALIGKGLVQIQNLLAEGVSGALLGSSGVGKSTLVNALLETEKMKISSIREDDAKGRHTTTHRELVLLPNGGILIDTPGMRELQLWEQNDSFDTSFQDIEEFAERCKFRNCTHTNEPGCFVQQKIQARELETKRLQSYFKLKKELDFIEKKTMKQTKLEEKRKEKKAAKKNKKKYKNNYSNE
ncbi:ribosome small subunit-dependent GTPase A [Niallia sp. NCCP-28]|uniref:ribosome small subunit-dependent GTPase A n=1 Tax=Niallia sp. NCCP-28 TaxID=2934712 RepID=UPI002086900E|nr:ribosome small subunit-dependent GTPase A [Niallia sp. NCCP-28]GKU83155.1 putative ribosome biogenesis GTPase RsgA [Niallia sp. NCCP-28]